MTKNAKFFCAIVLAVALLAACAGVSDATAEPYAPDDCDTYLAEPEVTPKVTPEVAPEPEPQPEPEPEIHVPDEASQTTISRESLDALREVMFVGVGEGEVIPTGGMEFEWYHAIFDTQLNGICGRYINYVGIVTFRQWRDLPRDGRLPFLLEVIEYFNLSMEDMIRVQRNPFGSQDELDEQIYWARSDEGIGDLNRPIWINLFTSSDFEALFSGDVYRLWEAFPGFGVVQNGRAYSPEWILNNIKRAVHEEQIPLGEIWRILNMAEDFPQLDDVVANAQAFLQDIRPRPHHYGTFDGVSYGIVNRAFGPPRALTLADLEYRTPNIVRGRLLNDAHMVFQFGHEAHPTIVTFGHNVVSLEILEVIKGDLRAGDTIRIREPYYIHHRALFTGSDYLPSTPYIEYIFFLSNVVTGSSVEGLNGAFPTADSERSRFPVLCGADAQDFSDTVFGLGTHADVEVYARLWEEVMNAFIR